MKYKSFEDLPDHIAKQYKKIIISTKPMSYEPNPSYTEEELDKIVQDYIKFRNVLWHGLPNQIAKLIAEECKEFLQPDVWQEDNIGKLILYGYEEGVFNGKGEKIMSWEDFQKEHANQRLTVNISNELKNKLISRGIFKE